MPAFFGVQRVVEADADDLARRVDGQRGLGLVERELGGSRRLRRGGLDRGERGGAGGDQGLEVLGQRRVRGGKVDHAVALDQPEGHALPLLEHHQLHGASPVCVQP